MLRKLASQTMVYGISAILSKFLNYMLTPYLTRVLSEQVYGQMSLYYAIIPFANVLLTMGLSTAYFRYAAKCDTTVQRRTLFTSLWVCVAAMSIGFFGVSLLGADWMTEAMGFDNKLCWIATAALIMIDNIAALPLASLREQGKARYYTLVNVSGVFINVAACVFFYSFMGEGTRDTALWVLIANIIASSCSLLLLLRPTIANVVRRIDRRLIGEVLIYSLPLMLAGLMGTAGDFIDRIMLWKLLPEDVAAQQVGIYAAVAKIAALMVIFRQIYSLGAEPFFLQKFKGDDFERLNARATNLFCAVGIIIFLGIWLFRSEFAMIIGGDFRVGMQVVPLLLLANLFNGLLINLSFWYKVADMTRMAIYVTILGITTTIVLNMVLIPEWGYVGSAWARVGSTFVMIAASYLLGQKYHPVPYDLRRIGYYFALGAVVFTLSVFTQHLGWVWKMMVNSAMILVTLVLFMNKENLKIWKRLK